MLKFSCPRTDGNEIWSSFRISELETYSPNGIRHSNGDIRIQLKEPGELIISNTIEQILPVDLKKEDGHFFTLETASRSTGICLSIAKSLCQKLGIKLAIRLREPLLEVFLKFPSESEQTL